MSLQSRVTFLTVVMLTIWMVSISWQRNAQANSASTAPVFFPINRWLALDGVDDYARATHHPELNLASESDGVTIEGWVKLTSNVRSYILNKSGSYFLRISTYSSPADRDCLEFLLFQTSSLASGQSYCWDGTFFTGNWLHVAGVHDNTTRELRIFANGSELVDATRSGPFIDSMENLFLGDVAIQGFDEVRISDIARYSTAFQPPLSPFTCDEHTRALWHFDEPAGATIFHDACGATDNVLTGYGGAHIDEAYIMYLPLVRK